MTNDVERAPREDAMKIIVAPPPRHQLILDTFKIHGRCGIVFCYGDTIFNPDNITLHPAVVVHEKVHSGEQGNSPDAWWDRYLADAEFRFDQEVMAHRAEWQFLCNGLSRGQRQVYLRQTARRLASSIYDRFVTVEQAKALIRTGGDI